MSVTSLHLLECALCVQLSPDMSRSHNGYGNHCFAAAGPSLWNSLPLMLREPDISFNRFKSVLMYCTVFLVG